jgi:hypothetical protein
MNSFWLRRHQAATAFSFRRAGSAHAIDETSGHFGDKSGIIQR